MWLGCTGVRSQFENHKGDLNKWMAAAKSDRRKIVQQIYTRNRLLPVQLERGADPGIAMSRAICSFIDAPMD